MTTPVIRPSTVRNLAGTEVTAVDMIGFARASDVTAEVAAEISQLAVRVIPLLSDDPTLSKFKVVVSSSLSIVTRATVAISGAGVGTITPSSGSVSALTTSLEAAGGNNFDFTVVRPAEDAPPGGVTAVATSSGARAGAAGAEVPPMSIVPPPAVGMSEPNKDGHVPYSVRGGSDSQSLKLLLSKSAAPTLAAVRATTAINAAFFDSTFTSAPLAYGEHLWLAALSYSAIDGGGLESPLVVKQATRQHRWNVGHDGSAPNASNINAFFDGTNSLVGNDTWGRLRLERAGATEFLENGANIVEIIFDTPYNTPPIPLLNLAGDLPLVLGIMIDVIPVFQVNFVTEEGFTITLLNQVEFASGTEFDLYYHVIPTE